MKFLFHLDLEMILLGLSFFPLHFRKGVRSVNYDFSLMAGMPALMLATNPS